MDTSNSCFGILPHKNKSLFDGIVRPLVPSLLGLAYEDAWDSYEGESTKMDFIARRINAARLVIVDLSEPNPNVFFEYGLAHALKKPAVLICRRSKFKEAKKRGGWERKMPFDIEGRELLLFANKKDLRIKLGSYIIDALFKTDAFIPSWAPDHTPIDQPISAVQNPSQIKMEQKQEVWSMNALQPGFLVSYRVKVSKIDANKVPDVRLLLSPSPGANSGKPRLSVIYPWEDSGANGSTGYECHIDYQTSQADENAVRLQRVTTSQRKAGGFEFSVFVSFLWPNIVVESSLFDDGLHRILVPLERVRGLNYPTHLAQHIGFSTQHCDAVIDQIKIKRVAS